MLLQLQRIGSLAVLIKYVVVVTIMAISMEITRKRTIDRETNRTATNANRLVHDRKLTLLRCSILNKKFSRLTISSMVKTTNILNDRRTCITISCKPMIKGIFFKS